MLALLIPGVGMGGGLASDAPFPAGSLTSIAVNLAVGLTPVAMAHGAERADLEG